MHVVDADTLSHSDPIADFQCLFTVDYRLISRDISSSDWSPTQDCQQVPADSKNDIRFALKAVVLRQKSIGDYSRFPDASGARALRV